MATLTITQQGDQLIIMLDEAARAELSAQPGQKVQVSAAAEAAPLSDHDLQLARGRRFLERYRATFAALAKT